MGLVRRRHPVRTYRAYFNVSCKVLEKVMSPLFVMPHITQALPCSQHRCVFDTDRVAYIHYRKQVPHFAPLRIRKRKSGCQLHKFDLQSASKISSSSCILSEFKLFNDVVKVTESKNSPMTLEVENHWGAATDLDKGGRWLCWGIHLNTEPAHSYNAALRPV